MPSNLYSGYRLHNYHFVIYGALFLGQIEPALAAIRGAAATVPDEMLQVESPPMADYFESYLSFEPHVLVRFGKWQEAIDMALPDEPDLYCTLAANVLYAKGVAHAALGNVEAAEAAEAEFLEAKARMPKTRLLHNNKVINLLEIAAAMLLEQGRIEEAEATFRADLGLGGGLSRASIHPDNVWSLKGLHDCLEARGETIEIVQVKQRLELANAKADGAVAASCFCAQATLQAAE